MKVQFGCGGNLLEGWVNHDAEVDISKPLPYADGSVEMVFTEHCFEHIDSHSAVRFLDECYRILQPGGVIRLCVPVLERLPVDHARDIIFGHGHLAAYTTNLLIHLLRVAGFRGILETRRKDIDHHWRVIGEEKDALETARVEGIK